MQLQAPYVTVEVALLLCEAATVPSVFFSSAALHMGSKLTGDTLTKLVRAGVLSQAWEGEVRNHTIAYALACLSPGCCFFSPYMSEVTT